MNQDQLIYIIGFSILALFILVVLTVILLYAVFFGDSINGVSEEETNCIPEKLRLSNIDYDNAQLFGALPALERARFILARKFYQFHKPALNYVSFTSYEAVDAFLLAIRDRGIRAFHFERYSDQLTELIQQVEDEREAGSASGVSGASGLPSGTNEPSSASASESTPLLADQQPARNSHRDVESGVPAASGARKYMSDHGTATDDVKQLDYRQVQFRQTPYVVEELTDIRFLTSQMSSALTNMPLPYKSRKNDTVYFETKLYELNPQTTTIAIGLATKPYPNFQLPGMSPYSVAVQTDGTVRMNNRPFLNDEDLPVTLPPILEGDVIGIGYRSMNGAVFITHNGKTVLEAVKSLKSELYPCIGSVGGPCRVSVNWGQQGFVFIEANVKKLGFCENKNEGTMGAPPTYDKTLLSKDPLLDKGAELPPGYPEEEQTFFGPKAVAEKRGSKQRVGSSQETGLEAVKNEKTGHGSVENGHESVEDGHESAENGHDADGCTATRTADSATPVSDPPSYHSQGDDGEPDEKAASAGESGSAAKEAMRRKKRGMRSNKQPMDASEYERMVTHFRSPTSTPPVLDDEFATKKILKQVGYKDVRGDKEESVRDESVRDEGARNESMRDEIAKNETAKNETAENDAAENDAVAGLASVGSKSTSTGLKLSSSKLLIGSKSAEAHLGRSKRHGKGTGKRHRRRKKGSKTTF